SGSSVSVSGVGHGAEREIGVADQIENADLEFGSRAAADPRNEPKRVTERLDRLAVRESSNRIVGSQNQVAHGGLVLVAILEMLRKFCRELLLPSARSAERLEALPDRAMEPDSGDVGEPLVDHLPIESVPELVLSRQSGVR